MRRALYLCFEFIVILQSIGFGTGAGTYYISGFQVASQVAPSTDGAKLHDTPVQSQLRFGLLSSGEVILLKKQPDILSGVADSSVCHIDVSFRWNNCTGKTVLSKQSKL